MIEYYLNEKSFTTKYFDILRLLELDKELKIHKNAKEGIVSFSEGDEQRMMLMGLKRFTKYQNQPNVVGLRNGISEKVQKENKYPF